MGETSPSVPKIAEAEYRTPSDAIGLVPFQAVLDLFQVEFDLYLAVLVLNLEVIGPLLEVLVLDWFLAERRVKEAGHWSVARAGVP